jgi:hypothetical protein
MKAVKIAVISFAFGTGAELLLTTGFFNVVSLFQKQLYGEDNCGVPEIGEEKHETNEK